MSIKKKVIEIQRACIYIKNGFLIINITKDRINDNYHSYKYHEDIKIIKSTDTSQVKVTAREIYFDTINYSWDLPLDNQWLTDEILKIEQSSFDDNIEVVNTKPERTWYGKKTGNTLHRVRVGPYKLKEKKEVVFEAQQYAIITENSEGDNEEAK